MGDGSYLFRADIEGSSHPSLGDPHVLRADELRALGDDRAADRVMLCGAQRWPGRLCRRRDCPTCAAYTARRHADRYNAAVAAMQHPVLILLTCPSKRIDDLGPAIVLLRGALAKLRRRECFSAVTAGVGGVEPKLSNDGQCWALHAHLVLDVAGALTVDAVDRAWRALTQGRGQFSVHETPNVFAPANLARYATKSDDWSPPPGSMPLECLAELRRSIRGRRLLIQWPVAKRTRSRGARPQ